MEVLNNKNKMDKNNIRIYWIKIKKWIENNKEVKKKKMEKCKRMKINLKRKCLVKINLIMINNKICK